MGVPSDQLQTDLEPNLRAAAESRAAAPWICSSVEHELRVTSMLRRRRWPSSRTNTSARRLSSCPVRFDDRGGAIPSKRFAGPRASSSMRSQSLADLRGNQRVTESESGRQISRRSRNTGAISPQLARQGKIDPVIGRDEEIRRVMQVLIASHEKQSRSHRRTWRRQNRHRRRPRPPHHQRRRSRNAQEQAARRHGYRRHDRRRKISR